MKKKMYLSDLHTSCKQVQKIKSHYNYQCNDLSKKLFFSLNHILKFIFFIQSNVLDYHNSLKDMNKFSLKFFFYRIFDKKNFNKFFLLDLF